MKLKSGGGGTEGNGGGENDGFVGKKKGSPKPYIVLVAIPLFSFVTECNQNTYHLSNSEAFDMFIRSPPRDIDKSLASSLLILAPLPLLGLEPLPGPSPNDGMPAREPGLEPGPVPVPVPVPGVRTVSLAATLVALPLIPPPPAPPNLIASNHPANAERFPPELSLP